MKLLSVNISGPKTIERGGKSGQTGIFKESIAGTVNVGVLGLKGDTQVDSENHGGKDQAVYLYNNDDYAWWSEQLGLVLEHGTFGENLTLSSLPEPLYIGDRFAIGSDTGDAVILEVTAPRIPCSTLAARMNDLAFVKKFAKAAKPGVYTRVIQTGSLQAGNEVKYIRGQYAVTTLEEFQMFYQKVQALEDLERLLAAPIAERSRQHYEKVLEDFQIEV
ncbi:MAG: MOSC domain-containing protein [Trueperaceae bacterium]